VPARLTRPFDAGLTVLEVLVALTLLAVLMGFGFSRGPAWFAKHRLEVGLRQLDQDVQRARLEAARRGEPCGMTLGKAGWTTPISGDLMPCFSVGDRLGDGLSLTHNFPEVLRFSANGLVLDGGTAVLSTPGTSLVRCMVMSLPLGITRMGRYGGGRCEADPSL
jgi:prepilin-type N-terminal cleavage/methylation domain-containing protein